MAYVAINPAFLSRVEAKIQSMCEAEIKTLGEMPIPQLTDKSEFFLDNVWGEHKHLYALMPSEYKNNFGEWRIVIKLDEAQQFNVTLPTKHMKDAYPPNYSWYNHREVDANPEKYPEIVPLVEHLKARAEINVRWTNVDNKVIDFLKECKSLNEAIKLWPDLKVYIDEADMKRLDVKHAKSDRASKAAEVLAGMDTDELMGAAVIARLSGAEV